MDIREFFESLTPEQIEEGNRKQFEENQRIHKEFKNAFKKGFCSLCGARLKDFDRSKPCYHWFLKPTGIRKKHFKKYLATPIGFFRFDSYIRWVANLDKPLKNINDLKGEMNPSKVVEYTIRYKKIEWSISIGKTDRLGHLGSKNANFPHFHVQMVVDNRIFIRFNDFHIPLADEDIFTFRSLEEAADKVVWRNSFGMGMSVLENDEALQQLDGLMKRTEDYDNATFNTQTLVKMPEGKTISNEVLNKLYKESKEKKIPLCHLIKKRYPDANIITELRPGDGFPPLSKRKSRK